MSESGDLPHDIAVIDKNSDAILSVGLGGAELSVSEGVGVLGAVVSSATSVDGAIADSSSIPRAVNNQELQGNGAESILKRSDDGAVSDEQAMELISKQVLPRDESGLEANLIANLEKRASVAIENEVIVETKEPVENAPVVEPVTQATEAVQREQRSLSHEHLLGSKVEIVKWMNEILKKDAVVVCGDESTVDLHEALKSGVLLCKMLNQIITSNASFSSQNLQTIDINEKTDLFACVSNLSGFVRTCELLFKADRSSLFDPVLLLQDKNELPLLKTLHWLKQQSAIGLIATPEMKPHVSLTFDQLSTLLNMLTGKRDMPLVAYDPRVVMSLQDVDTFQRLIGKLDQLESSQKIVAYQTQILVDRFSKIESGQSELKAKLESILGGVLGAFSEVSQKLHDLKTLGIAVAPTATPSKVTEKSEVTADVKIQPRLSLGSSTAAPPFKAVESIVHTSKESKESLKSVTEQTHLNVSLANNYSADTVVGSVASSPTVAAAPLAPTLEQPAPQQQSLGGKVFKLPEEVLSKNLPKEENMRQSVLYEIMDSEADYVRDLNMMIIGHMKDLRDRKILDEGQIKTMFSNVEELLPVNQKLLTLIVARRDENPVIEGLGDLFLQISDSFMVYDEYCANYPMANQLLKDIKNREDMKAYIERSNANPAFRGLTLESFLIKPVQRICKYPLLLRELIKHTPSEHKDKPFLEKAMAKIEEVVTLVNEKTRAVGERDKMIELQNRIDANPPIDFASVSGRRIIRESPIQRFVSGKLKDRTLILFNDTMILCKQHLMNKVRLQYEVTIDLKNVALNANVNPKIIGNSTNSSKMIKTMFELTCSGESYVFNCSTEVERSKWVILFEEALRSVPELVSKRAQTAPEEIPSLPAPPAAAPTSRPTSGVVQEAHKISNNIASFATSLKKSNTLSMKKRPTLWGRKKNSSNEDLAEIDGEQKPAEPAPAATATTTPTFFNTAIPRRRLSVGSNSSPAERIIAETVTTSSASSNNATGLTTTTEESEGLVVRRIKEYTDVSKRSSVIDGNLASLPFSLPSAPQSGPPEGDNMGFPQQSEPKQTQVEGYPEWKAVDAGNGSVYYFNQETRETTWYHPSVYLQQSKEQPAAQLSNMSPEEMAKLYNEKLESMQKLQEQINLLNQQGGPNST